MFRKLWNKLLGKKYKLQKEFYYSASEQELFNRLQIPLEDQLRGIEIAQITLMLLGRIEKLETKEVISSAQSEKSKS